ncbi:MAG TPA: hypothetical protein VG370_05070 [Chloroflexota bacterium]|jgi:hypothetical protein|nr:hypothetical protein [Chloroflexota bacterium]
MTNGARSAGPLVALAVGLAAAAPLARGPYFASDDGLVHLWRVWEYHRVAAESGPVVRWVPDAAYGYGTPLFTFYSPLAYALGAGLMGLGLSAAEATRALFGLALIGSALGAYCLGAALARRSPTFGGLSAALLYTLVPYRLATVYHRGALAEALGLAIAPFAVLAALRVGRSWGWVGWLGLASAALALTHAVAALIALPLAGLLGLAGCLPEDVDTTRRRAGSFPGPSVGTASDVAASVGLSRTVPVGAPPPTPSEPSPWPAELAAGATSPGGSGAVAAHFPHMLSVPWVRADALLRLAAGLALGAMLSAVYWLPAYRQQSTVHLERARWSGETTAFVQSFAWPWELVQPTLVHDYAADADRRLPAAERFPRVGLLGALALALGGALGLASGTLRRPVGLAALLALAAALALGSPAARPLWSRLELLAAVQLGWRFLGLALLAAVPLAASLGDAADRRLRWAGVSLAALAGLAGTVGLRTAPLDWAPGSERPGELAAFERKAGQLGLGALREYVPAWSDLSPEELLRATTPASEAPASRALRRVELVGAGATWRRYRVEAPAPTTLTFDLFFHPSLALRSGAERLLLRPTGDDGLATVDLPSGTHELTLRSEWTGMEAAAAALSAAAAALALIAAAGRRPRWLGAAAVVAVAIAAACRAPGERSAQGDLARPAGEARLGEAVVVLGARTETTSAGGTLFLTVDLHLRALRATARNDALRIWLVDAAGRRIVDAVGPPGGGLRPTTRWRPDELLVARHELQLPPGLPAGRYGLWVEMAGQAVGVGDLVLPATGGAAGQVAPGLAEHETQFGDGLVLDGYSYDRAPQAGALAGSFWWRRVAPWDASFYQATLTLTDKQGGVLAAETRRISGPGALRPSADFVLRPGSLPAESYRLELALRSEDGRVAAARKLGEEARETLLLQWLDVRDPCNCAPPDARAVGQRFADGVELVAWRAERDGADLLLSLYWRAWATPSRNYTAFVHLLDGERRVAQVDDQPNAGRRPTGAWRAGEVVHDRYRLAGPAGGATQALVGMYGSDGRRLPTEPASPDGAVRLELEQ